MAKSPSDISRSHRFTLSFQLEGLCEGLRASVRYGQQPEKVSLALLNKLKADILGLVQGPILEGLPELDDSATLADLLTMAEFLNATLKSFLMADEVKGWAESAASWLGLASRAKDLVVGR